MNAQRIDCFGALASPWTFMGHDRLRAMAGQAGVEVRFCPVDLLAVFGETGGLPLGKRPPARRAYRMQELKRWRARLDLPLVLEPAHFPVDETEAALLTITARLDGADPMDLAGRFMRAVWIEERNISDAATIDAIVTEAGLDPSRLRDKMAAGEAQAVRAQETAEAIERGVFGAPTYFFDDQMLWGQDRLEFLERMLAGK